MWFSVIILAVWIGIFIHIHFSITNNPDKLFLEAVEQMIRLGKHKIINEKQLAKIYSKMATRKRRDIKTAKKALNLLEKEYFEKKGRM